MLCVFNAKNTKMKIGEGVDYIMYFQSEMALNNAFVLLTLFLFSTVKMFWWCSEPVVSTLDSH